MATDLPSPAPRLSFAIPYYRDRGYLAEAIASVRAQTIQDWDLTIVDDAGPEPAPDLIEALADPRIRYVRNERNLGLAGNWNECVRLATAPLVNVLHADDRLLPEYGARVLAAAEAHPHVAAIFTDVRIIGSDGAPTRTLPDLAKHAVPRPRVDHVVNGDRALAGLLAGNYILCPTLCLRRAIVGDAPFDARWQFVLDQELTTRLLLDGESLFAIRTPLLEYRRHGGSQTSALTVDTSRFEEELEFSRMMAATCAARGWTRSARAARRRLLTRGHLLVRAGADLLGGRRRVARREIDLLWRDLRGAQRVGADDADPQQ